MKEFIPPCPALPCLPPAGKDSVITYKISIDEEGHFKVFNYEQLCCSGKIKQISAAVVEDPGRREPDWPHDEAHTVDHDSLYR